MSRVTKISLLIFGIVIISAIVMAVLVKILVTPKKVLDALVPLAEHSLQRKVAVDKISIGLFSGISVHDLQVRQKIGADTFIAVKSMDLHYRFLPLLAGKVVINHVKLIQPRIVVIRHPDGTFNFSDLLGDTETKKEEKAAQTGPVAASEGKVLPASATAGPQSTLNLLVNRVAIADGQLLFIDRSHPGRPSSRCTLDHLALLADHVTLDTPFPVELSAVLNGAKTALSGTYNLRQRSGRFNLDLRRLDLHGFAPYLSTALPGRFGSGRLSLQITTKFNPKLISAKGMVVLNQFDLRLNALPKAELKQAQLEIDSSLSYRLDNNLLDFYSLIIKLNRIPVRAVGKIRFGGAEPDVAMALFLDHLNLQKLDQGLPAGLAADIRPYMLSGQVNALMELAGKPSSGARLLKKADLRFENVQANLQGLPTEINGGLDFDGHQIKADQLLLDIGGQKAQVSFKAANLFSGKITGDFRLTADTFNTDKLFPAPEKEATATGAGNGETAPLADGQSIGKQAPVTVQAAPAIQTRTAAQEVGPFAIPADIKGSIAMNQVTYRHLELDHPYADILLKNNHLTISRIDCGLAGGKLNASADINLGVKGLAYSGQLNLNQLQLAVVDSGLFPGSPQSITGMLDSQNTFTGRDTGSGSSLKTLQVKGRMLVKDGQVSGSPLLLALANFLGNQNLETLSFKSLKGSYVMNNGLVALQGDLVSSILRLKPVGTVAVDGGLNINLNALLSPEAMSRLGSNNDLVQIMTDENGWGVLPLKLAGTLSGPRIALDSTALQKQVVGKARQELERQLLNKIAPDTNDRKTDQSNRLLDSTLKNIFGN